MAGLVAGGGSSDDTTTDDTSSGSDRDTMDVVESSPYRSSDAESDVVDADGGERETTTLVDAGSYRNSSEVEALFSGASSTDGFGDTSADVTIDATSTMVDPPGSVPEPDPDAGDGEYTTNEDITIEESTDPEDMENPGAEGVNDVAEDVQDAADYVYNEAEEAANEARDFVDLSAKEKAAAAALAILALLIIARPYASAGATAAGAVN